MAAVAMVVPSEAWTPTSPDVAMTADNPPPTITTYSKPLPLPDFVFPARAATPRGPNHSSLQGVPSIPGYRTIIRSSEPAEPLPAFTFGQASTALPTNGEPSSTSPGMGDASLAMLPAHHRRGVSEVIGGARQAGLDDHSAATHGDLTMTNGTLVSSPPAGARRRGHAHRRSAAISCHDLSSVLKASSGNAAPRSGSAPASPSEPASKIFSMIDGTGHQAASIHPDSGLALEEHIPDKAPSRTRVGFSDDVEVIPRPLSIVSSDASSTMTVRQGHSVSNSMSSIVSGSISSSPAGKSGQGASAADNMADARPRTAGSVLDAVARTAPLAPLPIALQRPQQTINTQVAPASKSHSPVSPKLPRKSWNFFGSDDHAETTTAQDPAPKGTEPQLSQKSREMPASPPVVRDPILHPIERTSSRRSSITRKPSKKHKKVKTLAGLLSRKPLHRKHTQKPASRRSPTPPMRQFANLALDTENVSPGTTTVDLTLLPTGSSAAPPLQVQTDYQSWRPKAMPAPTEDDSLSPIIDLDAALGPFNTPTSYDPTWEMITNGSTSKPRRMHSAIGAAGYGMGNTMYHRRAESAPEFENPRFKFGRLGSSSTMADVFEEDEEDEDWEDSKHSDKGSMLKRDECTGLGIDTGDTTPVKSMPDTEPSSKSPSLLKKSSGLSEDGLTYTTVSTRSENNSIHDQMFADDLTQPMVEIAGDAESRPGSRAESDRSSAVHARLCGVKNIPPVDILPLLVQPLLTPVTPGTPFSASDSPRTPMSDTQRIFSTAPSSVSEDQAAESLLLGEPGPELIRLSHEGVGSFSSADSIIARDSTLFRPSTAACHDSQRSGPLSGSSMAKKRSSMASLSRLIGSSHGEKSKLSIESRPGSAIEPDFKEKSKPKRLSRLMNFWRPKSHN